MKKFKFLLLCSLLATAFVACDDDEDVDNPVLPTVEVEAGVAGETTLTFTITSTEAKSVKYIVLEAGSREVNAELILKNGNTAQPNIAFEAKAEGLLDETPYEIWAAAQNPDGVALSEKVEMTTLAAQENPNPDPELVIIEGEEAYAEPYAEGNTILSIFAANASIDLLYTGEERSGEYDSESGTLLLDGTMIYDRTAGGDPVFVSVTEGSMELSDEGDGNYYVAAELLTEDNRYFLVEFYGPVEGWSEGGEVVTEECVIPADGFQWQVETDVLGLYLTGYNAEMTYGFSFFVYHGQEGFTWLPTGQYLVADTIEAVDAMIAEYGMAPGSWPFWMNGAGGVIIYEGEYYDLSYNTMDYAMTIETLMPDEDMTAINFYLGSADKSKEFYFGYTGAIYGLGGDGGSDVTRYDYNVSYNEIKEFTEADGYTTVKFQGMYDMHLCFATNGNELAAADAWTEYDVATQMDLEKSVYMEFGLDEIVWHLESGTIGVKKTETGYIFNFFEVKTGKGDVVNYGLNLITHDQGFEAKLPEVEPGKTTISNCYTWGDYTLDEVTVAAVGGSYMILADATGAISAYTYDADQTFAIGDKVSVVGDTTYNDPYPCHFSSSTVVTKLSSGSYTQPEPYALTDLDAYFAAPAGYKYVSVTGTIAVEEGWISTNYYLDVEGQTTRVQFKYMTAELKEKIIAATGTSITVLGYTHMNGSGAIWVIPVEVGSDNGGSEQMPVEATLQFTLGYAQAAGDDGSDFYFNLADADGNVAGFYVEMKGIYDMYYMSPADYIFPYMPSTTLVAAASADDPMLQEVIPGHYLDTTQSFIFYNGKEYQIASAAADFLTGLLSYQTVYDGSNAEYDQNFFSGVLTATDGSVFTIGFSGALYTNGGGIGGM